VTGEQAAEQRAASVVAERDAIQANLLELDGNYTRQLLDGAPLTGRTRERWDKASATLASLWETYVAYSAVVDRVDELGVSGRPVQYRDLPELTGLLTGTSVRLTRARAPLARRDLADTGWQELTLEASVAAMRRAFTEVAEVTSAVETVWTEVGRRLDAVAEELTRARPLAAGLVDVGARHLVSGGDKQPDRGDLCGRVVARRLGDGGDRGDGGGAVTGRQAGPGRAERGADVGPVGRPDELVVAPCGAHGAGRLGGESECELGSEFAGQFVIDRAERRLRCRGLPAGERAQPVVPGDPPVGWISRGHRGQVAPRRRRITVHDQGADQR
jgi:hypothetical protein